MQTLVVMHGDSMRNSKDDTIKDGDVVTGMSISKRHITMHKEYIIKHKQGCIVTEITGYDAVSGTITASSKKPDKSRFPDQSISLSDVYELYNVINVSKMRTFEA